MQLEDSRLIAAEPPVVWAAILDAETLKACIPGCESMTGSVADGYEAVVVQKVGPVSARFTGRVTISDIVEGRSLRIEGEGKGGVAGFAKGAAAVVLDPVPEGTRLAYTVDAKVGGKLAQIGSRIIDGFAQKLAGEFFERLQAAVEPPPPDAADGGAAEETVDDSGEKKKGWFRRLIG
jgi:carbon monoxide dehydrogenase subunit G